MKKLDDKIGYIYKIVSPNNKIYIGQTLNYIKRKSDYRYRNFKQQIKLWNNCSFYNWNPSENFEIIEECLCDLNKTILNDREKFWINYFDSFKNGLNCNEGGHGNIGHKHSDETKQKIRNAHLGVKHSEERNKNKSLYTKGRKHTESSKEKMSSVKKDRMNEDIKKKISDRLIGNKNGIGNKGNSKMVICLNNNKIYNSIKEACDDLILNMSNVVNVCKGKYKKTKGYEFKYYE
jgi:group I intron endonuclease